MSEQYKLSPIVNDMFSLINHVDQTIEIFDTLLHNGPSFSHIIEIHDLNLHNPYNIHKNQDSPVIEVLDDIEEEEEKYKQIEHKPIKKWTVTETGKARVGMLNDFELDRTLANAFNTI